LCLGVSTGDIFVLGVSTGDIFVWWRYLLVIYLCVLRYLLVIYLCVGGIK
jgi:hypothetical protein